MRPFLNMPSMLDISFLMLIYFLLTSAQRPIEADLSMYIRVGGCQQPPAIKICGAVVQIQANGNIVIDGRLLDTNTKQRDLPLLEDKITAYKNAADLTGSIPVLTLIASDDAPYQRFIDVLNTFIKVGIKNIDFGGSTIAG